MSLASLQRVSGGFSVQSAAIYAPQLEEVGRNFWVTLGQHGSHVTLDSLTTVGGVVGVGDEATITDVTALHDLEGVWNITITDNAALPTNTAESLVDAIGEENIGGTVTIEGNAEGP